MPLVALAALATAGCAREGFYDDRNIDYVKAQRSAPLVLPQGRNEQRYRDAMPVPEAQGRLHTDGERFRAPSPERLPASREVERDFVERREVGSDRWLVVGADPGMVWPQLQDFARARGLQVQASDDARGVLETAQGRLSVRQGLRAGDSEVRCDQNGRPVAACLDALEQHFSARSESASAASLAGQQISREDRLRFEQLASGEWVVRIPLDIDRVWAELNHQLEADFSVENRRELLEQNPEQHDFLVSYMTASERGRGMLQIILSPDVRQMPQEIRLVLESDGPERTTLRAVNESERRFTEGDARELLERVSSLLR
ncbi:lipoprotein, NlpB [Halomonas sp. MCCC 1A17488]|uniref:Lipoprotein, NlpB n=2 Tax=Oceanospirillales TaxID=135619 RepID=A0ABX7WAT0_9GAMM|nr:lipoprotein, NlpB [Halomonas sp. MCCC 1A17488]MCG3239754.1 lipoprotein, NlpB [Halomonas sp. MCCC 1A17488]QPP51509.1 lipoprotein, NlpB [Halomonas sp. SS10-MC5]QTP56970.1 lipoprotein, NlpB [Halomonas sulfidoxydans]